MAERERFVVGLAQYVHLLPGEIVLTAIIPAHNEESSIKASIDGLWSQTIPPDRIIVIGDNCTDNTVSIALLAGADVYETKGNTHKKAGALNLALAEILPQLADEDIILIQDADSVLSNNFIESAYWLIRKPKVGAIGGIFLGEETGTLLNQFQVNEYARYAREVSRKGGRAYVLTGTATMFRARIAREVAVNRGGILKGKHGEVYNRDALTEDMELTLAIKMLGYKCLSPDECIVTTEIMPNWRMLWNQRVRWQRGAVDNLVQYGLNRITLPYIAKQIYTGISTMALWLYVMLVAFSIAFGFFTVNWWWGLVGLLFVVERVVTVPSKRGRLLALTMVPELLYDCFQQVVYIICLLKVAFKANKEWRHGDELLT